MIGGATLASLLSGLTASPKTAPRSDDAPARINSFADVLERAAARGSETEEASGETAPSQGGDPRETLADVRWREMTGERQSKVPDDETKTDEGAQAEAGAPGKAVKSGVAGKAQNTGADVAAEMDASAQQPAAQDLQAEKAAAKKSAPDETLAEDGADEDKPGPDGSDAVRRKEKPADQATPAAVQGVSAGQAAGETGEADQPAADRAVSEKSRRSAEVATSRSPETTSVAADDIPTGQADRAMAATAPTDRTLRNARADDDASSTRAVTVSETEEADAAVVPDEGVSSTPKRSSVSSAPAAAMSQKQAAAPGSGQTVAQQPSTGAAVRGEDGDTGDAQSDMVSRAAPARTEAAPSRSPAAPAVQASTRADAAVLVQSALPSAGSDSPPAEQIAGSIASDLEDLSPSRLALSSTATQSRVVKTMRLQLNPAELGVVNIRMQSVNGELRIHINADSDTTARMLRDDSDAIQSALRSAGIVASDVSIQSHRAETGQGQSFQNRDAPGQQPGGQQNRGDMSNESRQAYRDSSSNEAAYQPSGGVDSVDGGAVGDSSMVI